MTYEEALKEADRMPDCIGTYKSIKKGSSSLPKYGILVGGESASARAAMLAAEHVIRDNDYYVVYMQHRSMAEGGPFEISCRETRDFEYEMRKSMRDCLLHFKNGRAPNGRTDHQHNLILGFNKKSKRSYLK